MWEPRERARSGGLDRAAGCLECRAGIFGLTRDTGWCPEIRPGWPRHSRRVGGRCRHYRAELVRVPTNAAARAVRLGAWICAGVTCCTSSPGSFIVSFALTSCGWGREGKRRQVPCQVPLCNHRALPPRPPAPTFAATGPTSVTAGAHTFTQNSQRRRDRIHYPAATRPIQRLPGCQPSDGRSPGLHGQTPRTPAGEISGERVIYQDHHQFMGKMKTLTGRWRCVVGMHGPVSPNPSCAVSTPY